MSAGRSGPSRARATSCPTRSRRWHRIEAAARDLFARYGYREIRTPVFEETRALRPRHRRRDRHRLEGDVHLRRTATARSLTLRPGGHRGHRARGDRAQPDEHRPRAEGLRAGADVPPRAAAEGPLPPVPPGGRRGLRHGAPRRSTSRSSSWRWRTSRPAASPGYELVLNSVGDANCRPAYVETLRAALRAQAAPRCARDCQRRTETNPLRVLDCKVPRGPGGHRGAAEDRRPPLRRVPRPLRGGAARAGPAGHPATA